MADRRDNKRRQGQYKDLAKGIEHRSIRTLTQMRVVLSRWKNFIKAKGVKSMFDSGGLLSRVKHRLDPFES